MNLYLLSLKTMKILDMGHNKNLKMLLQIYAT